MKFNTKCVHGSGKPDSTGAISPAIYMSSTFSHSQSWVIQQVTNIRVSLIRRGPFGTIDSRS